jgi:hypothetical protein
MDASDELRQLFDATQDSGNRRAVIRSLGIAGNTTALASIAANASLDERERIEAMHALGVAGDDGGKKALVDLYGKATTPALREAALHGLQIADATDAVLALYRNARSADEKKSLLRVLTTMDDDRALEAIERELATPEQRR